MARERFYSKTWEEMKGRQADAKREAIKLARETKHLGLADIDDEGFKRKVMSARFVSESEKRKVAKRAK